MKKRIRKAMMTCVLGGMLAIGIGNVVPEQVFASPFVKIDYGEYRDGKFHHWWDVDLGSIKRKDNETIVRVDLDTNHYAEGARVYHFKYKKDHWVYMYDTWTGKGDFSEGIFWNRVSKSKLANDVLYIVNNH